MTMVVRVEDKVLASAMNLKSIIMNDPNWGINHDTTEKEFIKGMWFLNPQSYGARIEKWQLFKLGERFSKVPATEGRGDTLHRKGNTRTYIEKKNSILDSTNSILNMIQIRLFQPVNYYLLTAYDLRDIDNYRSYTFWLTHDQMNDEVHNKMSASAAHGTKDLNKVNENIEYRLSLNLEKENEHLTRWKDNYLVKDLNEVIEFCDERSSYSMKESSDKFYTKPEIAKQCLQTLDMDKYDLVIEPSAGNGSFFSIIENDNKIGLDIKPDHHDIKKEDWLKYQIPTRANSVLVVGNPPFGASNKLSKAFIKHAASFDNVDTIAFILPSAYNKHTLQKYVPIEYKLTDIKTLPANSFILNGENFDIPCCFFIFQKNTDKECLRFNPDLYIDTADWEFSGSSDYHFYVMGAALNTTKKKPTKNNRGYYIKVKDPSKVDLVENNFKKAVWKGYGTAGGGVAWFTKPEVVKVYKEQFN